MEVVWAIIHYESILVTTRVFSYRVLYPIIWHVKIVFIFDFSRILVIIKESNLQGMCDGKKDLSFYIDSAVDDVFKADHVRGAKNS